MCFLSCRRSLTPLLKATYLGLSTIVVNQIVKLKRYVQYLKTDYHLKIVQTLTSWLFQYVLSISSSL